ncbi:TetR/AcrR family transcriptional regulator [Streptomyces sp. NPDC026589]|uniref:TetR/AcrR family transcriptional regulator n=1 Tax=Streptomyces sp. NPDC026589 TaxID=3155609 RepID=UPI0033E75D2C
MTDTGEPGRARPRKGYPAKRRAILRASRKVFGQAGYGGASIDEIAAKAGVSTRTIYNHFVSKEELFATVVTDSTEQVAASHEAMTLRHLGGVTAGDDLEADLIRLARDWVRPRPEFTDHFAIVGRISTAGDDFPPHLRETWQKAGPLRVQRILASCMARLAERGLLRVSDADFAAQHFVVLVTNTWGRGPAGADAMCEEELVAMATAGVRAFLHGYLARS